MILVAIAWIYVVLLMAVAEATSSNGSLLGALITFVFYGALPLSIVMYVMNTPHRRHMRRAQALASATLRERTDPDGGDHAPGDPVAAERKEP
ncbi:MAG: hypothetical protein OEY03_07625 [Rhizobacter sp.]|nr:hypothetical protein [Rhizobacter sp.]